MDGWSGGDAGDVEVEGIVVVDVCSPVEVSAGTCRRREFRMIHVPSTTESLVELSLSAFPSCFARLPGSHEAAQCAAAGLPVAIPGDN